MYVNLILEHAVLNAIIKKTLKPEDQRELVNITEYEMCKRQAYVGSDLELRQLSLSSQQNFRSRN